MRPLCLVLVAVATLGPTGCGGESRPVAEQWNAICRDAVRERTRAELVTLADYRRVVEDGHRTLDRLRGRLGLRAERPAARCTRRIRRPAKLERRFLAEIQRRALVGGVRNFRKPAAAAAARMRRAFKAVGVSECLDYPYLV